MKSFKFATNGIIRTIREERSMRFHICAAFYVLTAGYVTGISRTEWAAVLLCIALVMSAECLNTAVEAACDEVTTKISPGIQRAKDASAGAVLICAVFSAAVGGMIFFRAGRIESAVAFAANNPALSVLLVLAAPVWGYYIISGR